MGWRARRSAAQDCATMDASSKPVTNKPLLPPAQAPAGYLLRYPTFKHRSTAGARAYHATACSAAAPQGPGEQPRRTPRPRSTFTWDDVMARPRPQRLIAEAAASTALSDSDVGAMYPVAEDTIPEAFEQWYDNREPKSTRSYPVEGGGAVRPLPHFVAGCSGLQHEFAQSRYPYVMYRCASAMWWRALAHHLPVALPDAVHFASLGSRAEPSPVFMACM